MPGGVSAAIVQAKDVKKMVEILILPLALDFLGNPPVRKWVQAGPIILHQVLELVQQTAKKAKMCGCGVSRQ
jgi:hypothetical protein